MQLQVTQENSPSYFGWRYPDGSIRITVEGVGEYIDGETLYTYTRLIGVEIGPSNALAICGCPDLMVFQGAYDEQRKCFNAWSLLANENKRPEIFHSGGMAALAKLDPAPMPPLPEIDEFATELANDVLSVSRKLIAEVGATGEELTQADCYKITATAVVALTGACSD